MSTVSPAATSPSSSSPSLAVLAGTVGPLALGALANPSAKDLIAADPPPTLFGDATVAPLEQAGGRPGGRRRTR